MEMVFDVIIAGGGLAGILTALRIHEARPEYKILILEKERAVGGRLKLTSPETGLWSCGLNRISKELSLFWDQELKKDPEAKDLPAFITRESLRVGVVSGTQITELSQTELFAKEGAKAIAGEAAVRDWVHVETLGDADEENRSQDQVFSQIWPTTRKSPSALVLEHIFKAYGVSDIWKANTRNLMKLAQLNQGYIFSGNWDEAITQLLARPDLNDQLTVKTKCRIAKSFYKDEIWELISEGGAFRGKRLVVAQPPWDALLWLSPEQMPPTIASITTKTTPTSVVVLSENIISAYDLPDTLLIPSEEVQVIVNPNKEICFQATLDYELTLQAPNVVKAIKRLRRARRKLLKAFPNLLISGDHLALVPVGWSHLISQSDKRWLKKFESLDFQSERLAFCGDCYGGEINGDKNLIGSVGIASMKASSSDHQ